MAGREIGPCAGVAAVAVPPEYRGRDDARALVSELLARERRDAVAVSVLYPANAERAGATRSSLVSSWST